MIRHNEETIHPTLHLIYRMKDYDTTIAYLFEQLPMYQKYGKTAIKKDLTNIRSLLTILESPHMSYPCIHVAGTNGKGTTAHMLASVFSAKGKKVGLYTSPHYVDFRERIKVDGTLVRTDFVVDFVNRLEMKISDIQPSFFEITVAMAFYYFHIEQVDIAIIETGLGGRLDSTNVIDPVLSVITNISLDHTDTLGPDAYTIAKEKAGIIKPGRPVVIGNYQASCDHVFMKKAAQEKSPVSFASVNWSIEDDGKYSSFKRRNAANSFKFDISKDAPFTGENITTTLEAIYQFNQIMVEKIADETVNHGISQYRSLSNYKGRWQVLGTSPLMIADSAHNYAAIKTVLDHLRQGPYNKIHFILGFVKDKEVDKILGLFDKKHAYYFTRPSIPRGLLVHDLLLQAEEVKLAGFGYEKVSDAVSAAKSNAHPSDLIFIGGSSFVVADILSFYDQ